jgi:hypothetical protein
MDPINDEILELLLDNIDVDGAIDVDDLKRQHIDECG